MEKSYRFFREFYLFFIFLQMLLEFYCIYIYITSKY